LVNKSVNDVKQFNAPRREVFVFLEVDASIQLCCISCWTANRPPIH